MIFGINISLLLLSTIPAIVYSLIIYFTTPKGCINLKTGLLYFLFGIFSISFLKIFNAYIPGWYEVNSNDIFLYYFILHFSRVALLEELVKFSSFRLLERINKNQFDHPIATMFYACMVGLGFAFLENLSYVKEYGSSVLYTRSFTSTVVHMLTGLMYGYWVAAGRLKYQLKTKSVFDYYMLKYPKVRFYTYILIGLITSMIYHGLYNYNLEVNRYGGYPVMILTILFGLYVCKSFAEDLISKTNSTNMFTNYRKSNK